MIISLSSFFPRSGKDSVAAQVLSLLDSMGIKAQRLAFADALKADLTTLMPAGFANAMEGTSLKDMRDFRWSAASMRPSPYRAWLMNTYEGDFYLARSPRWHMQQYGTNYVRQFLGQPNEWLDRVTQQMVDGTVYIITDTRFPNEFHHLKSLGATTCEIKPHGFPKSHPVYDQYELFKLGQMAKTEGQLADLPFDLKVMNEWGKQDAAARVIVYNVLGIPL